MTFQEDIPPIFQKLLDEIQSKGTVNYQEFKTLIYNLRIDEHDAIEIERWLKKRDIIHIQKGRNEYRVSLNPFQTTTP